MGLYVYSAGFAQIGRKVSRGSQNQHTAGYGQGSVRAASGTTLGVLGTSKMRASRRYDKMSDFTDFRGEAGPGSGGGMDTDRRIKLPPGRWSFQNSAWHAHKTLKYIKRHNSHIW
jgi:hypothetical protein